MAAEGHGLDHSWGRSKRHFPCFWNRALATSECSWEVKSRWMKLSAWCLAHSKCSVNLWLLPMSSCLWKEIVNMISVISYMYCCCSVAKLHLTFCNPMDCSTPGFPVLHFLPEFAQTHVHWVGDVIQPSHPLFHPLFSCLQSFPTSGTFPVSWLFDQVAKVLELQLQHQSFQWVFRVVFL